MPIIVFDHDYSIPSCEDLYATYLALSDPNLPPYEEWSANMVCRSTEE